MRTSLIALALTLGCFVRVGATGWERHAAIQQYLDNETVLVAWVDLSKLDVEEIAQMLATVDRPTIPERELSKLKVVQQALLQLHVTKIYWISDLASISEGPVRLVIPNDNPQAVQLLLGAMDELDFQYEVDGKVLLAGKKDALTAIKKKHGTPSSQLLQAMEACDQDHGLAFATPSYVTMSLMAVFQAEIKKGDASELVKTAEALAGLQWMALSASLNQPEFVRLKLQTESNSAAKTLLGLINSSIEKRLKHDASRLAFEAEGAAVQYTNKSFEETVATVRELMSIRGSTQSANSLKQVALALHNYAAAYKHFPPQSLVDEKGNRLLSWRVLILPFLGEQELYDKFHLDEPWNSPHNIKLASSIPKTYATNTTVAGNLQAEGLMKTRIVAPMTKDSAFGRPGEPVWFKDLTDGTSNTLWFVETSEKNSVVWTKPEDLPIDISNPVVSIIGDERDGFLGGMVDGSVRFYSAENRAEVINALLTIDGGEVIDHDELK